MFSIMLKESCGLVKSVWRATGPCISEHCAYLHLVFGRHDGTVSTPPPPPSVTGAIRSLWTRTAWPTRYISAIRAKHIYTRLSSLKAAICRYDDGQEETPPLLTRYIKVTCVREKQAV